MSFSVVWHLTCYSIQMIDSDLQNLEIRYYNTTQMHVKIKHPYVALHENPYWASGYIISLVDFINFRICYVFYLLIRPQFYLCCQIPAAVFLQFHSSLWCFDSLVESVLTDKDVSSHSRSWQLPQLWQLEPICIVRRVLSFTFHSQVY